MNTLNTPEFLDKCRELVSQTYGHMPQYVQHHEDDVYVFITDESDEVTFCMCSNPTVGFPYSMFDPITRQIDKEYRTVYLTKFGGTGRMTSKALYNAMDELVHIWYTRGFDKFLASVTPAHARVWNKRFGTKNLTDPVMLEGHAEVQLIIHNIEDWYV